MNWKLRLKNKTTLTAIILGTVALVYQILGVAKVVSPVAQDEIAQTAGMLINLLVLLGVVVDPTTKGVGDSMQAMTYTEPKKDEVQ